MRAEWSQEDAKSYVLSLVERGQLLLGLPLPEKMKAVLEKMGFESVRIDFERVHSIYLLRARIGPNLDCRSVGAARKLLFRMARQVGKRITPGLLMPSVERGNVRCAILFLDARCKVVDLDARHG